MLKVYYTGSNVYADSECEEEAIKTVEKFHKYYKPKNIDYEVCFASGLVISYLRVVVLRGLIDPDDIQFLYNNTVMICDKYGTLDWWAPNFDIPTNDAILNELVFNEDGTIRQQQD